ncbi:MAG: hypothetical protein ABIQ32_03970 [Sphingomicrobium sp.]
MLLLGASLMSSSCFVGDEGPPMATREEVEQSLKACGLVSAEFEQQPQSDQYTVTVYDDEPDSERKLACLGAKSENEYSFAIVGRFPRISGSR